MMLAMSPVDRPAKSEYDFERVVCSLARPPFGCKCRTLMYLNKIGEQSVACTQLGHPYRGGAQTVPIVVTDCGRERRQPLEEVDVLKEILPPFVAVADITDSEVEVRLFPEEEAAVRAASTRRRRDFALGRHCAHRALAALGASCGPLLNDPSRAPRWPQSFVGSITHCAGYCAALVASKQDVKSIGIDAEPVRPLPPGVLDLIAHHEEEKTWIESHPVGSAAVQREGECLQDVVSTHRTMVGLRAGPCQLPRRIPIIHGNPARSRSGFNR